MGLEKDYFEKKKRQKAVVYFYVRIKTAKMYFSESCFEIRKRARTLTVEIIALANSVGNTQDANLDIFITKIKIKALIGLRKLMCQSFEIASQGIRDSSRNSNQFITVISVKQ